MLSFEALTAEAKQRGMPTGKMRGILREYLQVFILKERTAMQATISPRDNSTFDTAKGRQLHLVARQASRGDQSVTVPPLPPMRRLQRLVSWLSILACGCPACRLSSGKQPDTAWPYSYL